MNKISVIMSVWNSEKYVRQSIESITNQTVRDFEFVIVDDCSADATPEILREFAKKDKRIKLVRNSENIGLTKSLNKALSIAKGEYVARQDADDYSHPDRLRLQRDFLDAHRDISLVGTSAVIVDEQGLQLCTRTAVVGSDAIKSVLQKENCFFHGSIMFRKSDVQEIGGYRDFLTYGQDYDLYLRLCEKKKLDGIVLPLYFWRLSPSGISVKKQAYHALFGRLIRLFNNERQLKGKDSYAKEFIEHEVKTMKVTKQDRRSYEYKRTVLLLQGGHFNVCKKFSKQVFIKNPSLVFMYFYYALYYLYNTYLCTFSHVRSRGDELEKISL